MTGYTRPPPREKGIYALILRIRREVSIRLRSRSWSIEPGIYVYIGSAGGPGGLRARILRHISRPSKRHWHIDYLTSDDGVETYAVVYTTCSWGPRAESLVASCLHNTGLIAVEGFGATDDKTSKSHLYKLAGSDEPSLDIIVECMRVLGRNCNISAWMPPAHGGEQP